MLGWQWHQLDHMQIICTLLQTENHTSISSPTLWATVFGRPFVKRFALCYQTIVCLSVVSVLSVTFVHCGQTVGRIKMKLGKQVGLGPGHIVLGGDPAPFPQRATAPPIFGRCCCCSYTAFSCTVAAR